MDKAELIRHEIEKRRNHNLAIGNPLFSAMAEEDIELLCFIDSLQEEPVSDDLEKAAKDYSNNLDNIYGSIGEQTRNAFKDGAKWQFERVNEALLSEVLPCFMHGGEADEVVAKLDEVLNQKR